MNPFSVFLHFFNIVFLFGSYVELSPELKEYFLSYYLLITVFIEVFIFTVKYFEIQTRIITNIFFTLNVTRILSYPYIIYEFPFPFSYSYCGIYDKYMACLAFQVISCVGIITYSAFFCFCFLATRVAVSRSHESKRMRAISLEIIKNLPVSIIPPDNNICSICLEDAKDEDEWKVLTCQHKFHTDCIDEWLLIQPSCPICRKDQIPQSISIV